MSTSSPYISRRSIPKDDYLKSFENKKGYGGEVHRITRIECKGQHLICSSGRALEIRTVTRAQPFYVPASRIAVAAYGRFLRQDCGLALPRTTREVPNIHLVTSSKATSPDPLPLTRRTRGLEHHHLPRVSFVYFRFDLCISCTYLGDNPPWGKRKDCISCRSTVLSLARFVYGI